LVKQSADTGTYSIVLKNASGQSVATGQAASSVKTQLSYTVGSSSEGEYTLQVSYTP
jgi:hypothetical protein